MIKLYRIRVIDIHNRTRYLGKSGGNTIWLAKAPASAKINMIRKHNPNRYVSIELVEYRLEEIGTEFR